MKRKTVLAMLVMCMAFSAAACGKDSGNTAESPKTEETADSTGESEEQTDGKETESGTEEKDSVRLVSVDDVSDYVTIGEYKGLQLDNVVQPVSEDDVDAEIEYQLQDKSEEVTDGTLEQGDMATVNFTATVDGKDFEGSSEQDFEFLVGESGMTDGFDDGLIGMKKGETRELSLTFPEEYYDSAVAGKTAVYQVTLQKFTRVPELTDEWIAANTDVKTVEEYRTQVRTQLEENARDMASYDLYAAAWTEVLDASEVKKYPQEDLDAAIQAYKDLNDQYIQEAGMDMDEFLESQGITEEEFQEECTRYAQSKVEQNLIVQGIMDKEKLSLEDKETQELQGSLVQEYGVADINELVEIYGQQEVNESLALRRVEKFIVDNAVIDEKVGGGDDLAENEDVLTDEEFYDTGAEEDTGDEYVDAGADTAVQEEAAE